MLEKKSIGLLFDEIAVTYDKINHILSMNADKIWRRKAVDMLRPCHKVLDLATGTADFAIEIADKHKAQHITGLDLSIEMMRIGNKKSMKKGFDNIISFETGSALDMPYPDSSFDAVGCAYGIRNFLDLDAGLSEMFRVLCAGGQLLILEFSYPENPLFYRIYDFYFSKILPFVGRMLSKNESAYSYLNQSVKHFIWGDEMLKKLESAGFKNVKYRKLSLGITTIYTATK